MLINKKLDVKSISKDQKKRMLENLINYNMYYECKELCKVFIDNIIIEREHKILYVIIKQCSNYRDKMEILKKIKEW